MLEGKTGQWIKITQKSDSPELLEQPDPTLRHRVGLYLVVFSPQWLTEAEDRMGVNNIKKYTK